MFKFLTVMKVKATLENISKYKRTEETSQLHSACDPGLDRLVMK